MESSLELNYHALTVSILTGCIPETAFDKLLTGKAGNQLTEADYDDMAKLRKQGLKLREISEIYGGLDRAIISKKTKGRVV